MRTLSVLALIGVVMAAGCGWNKAIEDDAPTPTQDLAGMPSPPFEGVVGWLGFSVVSPEARVKPWTPDLPNAKVVVFDPRGWDELSEGTVFTGVSSQGLLKLKFSELSEVPFGCDGVPTLMAAFQGPYDLAEELVWIVPGETSALSYSPIQAGPGNADRQEWRAGDAKVVATATGERKGKVVVSMEDRELWSRDFEQVLMEGASPDDIPFNLSDGDTISLPVPLAMVQLGPQQPPLLIMKTSGFEGANFEILSLGRERATSVGSVYVYICAF